jgi:hypothetical protein
MGVRGNLLAIGAVACAVLLANKWISVKSVIPADVAKQSDFLRTYNPVPLMNSFRRGCLPRTGVGTSSYAGPGYLFLNDVRNVRYTRTAHTELCDQSQYPLILAALHRSLLSSLDYFGCQVSSDDTAEQGVRIAYRCGTRSAGEVTTGPKPEPDSWPSFIMLQVDEEWSVR